ncbi:DNA polymerase III subunit gamma/tau, partial [bacterium]|nr:DNA polymerase III subunit gamma/tau [bacterium]
MSEYLVIARKWRPATFEELVGQEHIAKTLANAIHQGKIAHAFLLCGPRGVGKTSTARILAKALNCVDGPTPTPCCKCHACLEIASNNCLDVIEIDGASNNSVEDIRLLRENAKYAPTRDRYKVYIIDEVHMLTTSAFNALLKTLEEPPPHIKFIFATTAPERIPATILSRCQRFNFRRVGRDAMVKSLKKIAQKEGIDIDDDALLFICDKASGSMRDAQSILDQARSMTTGRLTERDVSELLSVTDTAFLSDLVDSLIDRDPTRVIRGVDELFQQGVNFRNFFSELVAYLHKMLLLLSVGKDDVSSVVQLTKDEARRVRKQADAIGKNRLLQYLNRLLPVENDMARSSMPRVAFEVAALGLCHIEDVVSVETLLKKLSSLQKSVDGANILSSSPAPPAATRKARAVQTPPKP